MTLILLIFFWTVATLVGTVLPQNRIAMRCAYFKQKPKRVFDIMSNVNTWNWRKNIKKIVIIEGDGFSEGSRFKEISKKGNVISINVEKFKPNESYELSLKGIGFIAHWKGYITNYENGARLFVTCETCVKNSLIRVISYLFFNLGNNIDDYLNDLQKEINQ